MRQPVLPKGEKTWSNEANSYRRSLHEDLYPKNIAWAPKVGGLTSTAIDAGYTRITGVFVIGISISGPTTASVGAFIDLPFVVSQYSVFTVSTGTDCLAAVVDKGGDRLYLPGWTGAGRVVISGVVVG